MFWHFSAFVRLSLRLHSQRRYTHETCIIQKLTLTPTQRTFEHVDIVIPDADISLRRWFFGTRLSVFVWLFGVLAALSPRATSSRSLSKWNEFPYSAADLWERECSWSGGRLSRRGGFRTYCAEISSPRSPWIIHFYRQMLYRWTRLCM